MKAETSCVSKKLELNGIINSTIVQSDGYTLGLHDKTISGLFAFCLKIGLPFSTVIFSMINNNKFEEQEVILYRRY